MNPVGAASNPETPPASLPNRVYSRIESGPGIPPDSADELFGDEKLLLQEEIFGDESLCAAWPEQSGNCGQSVGEKQK